ncbi:MAG: hypothetical protein U0228_30545 [Myxococcaceae bacterium]
MAETERVACKSCGKWVFHLAQRCPHCGTAQFKAVGDEPPASAEAKATKKPAELKLSAEEARALLAVSDGLTDKPITFSDVMSELLLPGEGVADLVLTLIAAPLTLTTVLTLGWLLLRRKRSERDVALLGAKALAVPVCSALWSVTLWELEAPAWSFGVVAAGFVAWFIRAFVRGLKKKDALV